eukprot:scaffold835_cov202-Alexandrium_tamarense.AAC.8
MVPRLNLDMMMCMMMFVSSIFRGTVAMYDVGANADLQIDVCREDDTLDFEATGCKMSSTQNDAHREVPTLMHEA